MTQISQIIVTHYYWQLSKFLVKNFHVPLTMNIIESVNTYYIDPRNGNDDKPGTLDRPFCSIQQGIDVARGTLNEDNEIYLKVGHII